MSGTQYNVAQTAGAILKKARKELADARSATYEGSKSDDRIKAAEKAVDSATNDFHERTGTPLHTLFSLSAQSSHKHL
jgi:hypothetical protein